MNARLEFEKPQIVVSVHKPSLLPVDPCYVSVHAGAEHSVFSNIAQFRDDTGVNISKMNPFYCELTTLYWFWRNCRAPSVGLSHYRRYFLSEKSGAYLTGAELMALDGFEVIAPLPRRYFVINVKDQLSARFGRSYWEILGDSISKVQPNYLKCMDEVGNRTYLHLYNMFIMRWELFDEYMGWLFSVLEEVEHALDVGNTGKLHERMVGHLSERLLDIWLAGNPQARVKEVPVYFVEQQREYRKAIGLLSDYLRYKVGF